MPMTTIDICTRYTREQEIALIEAVQSALLMALKLPETDRNVLLQVHEPHRMMKSPLLTQPLKRTHISIDAFAGRSLDAKRALYREIVMRLEAIEGVNIPRDHVLIRWRDLPTENWGLRGGQAACDVDLSFDIKV